MLQGAENAMLNITGGTGSPPAGTDDMWLAN